MQEFRSLRQASGLLGGGGGSGLPGPSPWIRHWETFATEQGISQQKGTIKKNLRTLYGYVVEARSLELPEKIQFGLLSLIKLRKMIQS